MTDSGYERAWAMASWGKGTTSKDLPLQAIREFLEGMDKNRAELMRERDQAVRSGNLDVALQCSKDLRPVHRDKLQTALTMMHHKHLQARQRVRNSESEWPRHEFWQRTLGRDAADAKLKDWKAAKMKEGVQNTADPFTTETLTTEFVWKEFSTSMESEETFVENLKRLAQKDANSSLVRACRNELRLYRKERLEGQMEISNFERDNPPPINPYAKTAEIMEARDRFIELVRELAEKSGVIGKSEET